MDLPGLGQTHHLGLDRLQACKIQVPDAKKMEGDW